MWRMLSSIFNDRCCESSGCTQTRTCGFRLYQCWLKQIKQKLAESKQVVRLLLYRAPIQSTSVALPLLLAYIRTHQLPVVILVTTQSWTSQEGLISLRRASDVVLQTEGFASRVHYPPPPEFRHLHGLLLLPKVSTVTAATANGGGALCRPDCQQTTSCKCVRSQTRSTQASHSSLAYSSRRLCRRWWKCWQWCRTIWSRTATQGVERALVVDRVAVATLCWTFKIAGMYFAR